MVHLARGGGGTLTRGGPVRSGVIREIAGIRTLVGREAAESRGVIVAVCALGAGRSVADRGRYRGNEGMKGC